MPRPDTTLTPLTVEPIDWFGKLMATRMADNEPHVAHFGQVNTDTLTVHWHDIDHCRYDGIGGFAEVLARHGHRIPQLPSDHPPPPRSILVLKSWWQCIRHIKSRSVRWNTKWRARFDTKLKHRSTPLLVFYPFTREETKHIEKCALKCSASPNSYLLALLSKHVAAQFIAPNTGFHWMIPTNLRGALRLADERANHCSTYSLDTDGNDSPGALHQRARTLFLRGDDWAMYLSVKFMGRWLPDGLSRLIQKNIEKKHPHVGCFTNLGYWHHQQPGKTERENEGWIVVPTANESNPIGAGAITWNGRLSIALELHPALQASLNETQSLFDQWKASLLVDFPSTDSSATATRHAPH